MFLPLSKSNSSVMREHVGKLHQRRPVQRPEEHARIEIQEGPAKFPPVFSLTGVPLSAPVGEGQKSMGAKVPGVEEQLLDAKTFSVTPDTGEEGKNLAKENPEGVGQVNEEEAMPSNELAPQVDEVGEMEAAQSETIGDLDTTEPVQEGSDQARLALRETRNAVPVAPQDGVTPVVDAPVQSGQVGESVGSEEAAPEMEATSAVQSVGTEEGGQPPVPPVGNGGGQGGNGGNGGGSGGGIGGGPELTPFEQGPVSLDTANSGALVQSLGSQQPTAIVASIGTVGGQLTTAQEGDLTEAEGYLPEIQQPTGLGTDGIENKKAVEAELEEGAAPEIQAPSGGPEQKVETEHQVPQGETPAERVPVPSNETLQQPGGLSQAIHQIPGVDGSIDTSAGPRPKVELTGEADPQHNQTAQNEANVSTQEAASKANTETQKDFKEGEIMPSVEPELMKVETELVASEAWSGQGEGLPQLDVQSAGALNAGIMQQYEAEISAEMAKETEGKADFDQKAQQEQQQGLEKIKAENEKAKQAQLDERQRGKEEIDGHRESWQAENEKVMKDFDTKSQAKRQEVEGKIQTKVDETNARVESEYARAEQEAASKTAKAESDIAAKKDEAAQKEQDKSWWDKVCDAVSSFFEALKEAVSAIFDALRAAVKAIIEGVKKLASDLIDMARDMIKGLISAFAEALKAFVRLALAAFPELAEKFCALIDQVVEAIHKAIDELAELLKTAVSMLLDAIGAAINALLDAYQAIINGILTVLEALTVGWIKIMQGIGNLVQAAVASPGYFIGQVSEEVLGSDVTQPLQNEYATEPVVEAPSADAQTMLAEAPEAEFTPNDEANAALLAKDTYTAEDFDVPTLQNETFGPELQAQISALGEGTHEFATFDDDAHGKEAIKAEAAGGQGGETATSEAPVAEGDVTEVPTQEAPTQAAPVTDPNRDRHKPDAQGMVGPFTAGERALFIAGQMVDGVKKWFSENWPTIVAALIGIILGAILLNIVTGGAIMAALPLVMQLVAAYFAAEAIVKMAGHFGQYLGQAFPGNIGGGAKSLARALAIGAIELVFTLLFGGKAAFKAVKNVAKTAAKGGVKGLAKGGVKLAKDGIKATAKNVKDLAKVAKTGLQTAGKNIVKGGKFAMTGLKRGFAAGSKSLDDLGKRLGKQFKFKKFRLRIQGRKWFLEGKVNPWVVVASGTKPEDKRLEHKGDINAEIPSSPARSKSNKFASRLNDGLSDGSIKLTPGKEAEEMDFLRDYLNKNKNVEAHPQEILDAYRSGHKMSAKGDLYMDVDGLPRVEARMVQGPDGKDLAQNIPFDQLDEAVQKQLQGLCKQRKAALDRAEALRKQHPNTYQDMPAYKAAMNEANELSRSIGEIGGRDALVKLTGDAKTLSGGAGSPNSAGTFDEVLETTADKKLHVPEYKGGHDDLGYATTLDSSGNPIRAQQGTPEHIKYTLASMTKKGGKAAEAAKRIQKAGLKNVEFSKVRTIFGDDGEVVEIIIKYFNLR